MAQITINDLKDLLNITQREATITYNKYSKLIKDSSLETLKSNVYTLKSKFKLSNSNITEIALGNFKTFLVDNNKLSETLQYIVNRFNLNTLSTKNFLVKKSHKTLILTQNEINDRINYIKSQAPITNSTLRKILTQTNCFTTSERATELTTKLQLLEAFNVDYNKLKNLYIVNHNDDNIIFKLKLAMLSNQDLHDFCEMPFACFSSSTQSLYSRYMAYASDMIKLKDTFKPSEEFLTITGLTPTDLYELFPLGTTQKEELDILFYSKFPEIDKKVDDIKREQYCKKTGTSKEDYNKQQLLEYFNRFDINENQFNKFLEDCPEILNLNLKQIKNNINNLKVEYGFTTENIKNLIITNPQNLLCSPNKLKEIYTHLNQRLLLSKRQFKNILYSSSKLNDLSCEFLDGYINNISNICSFTNNDIIALIATSRTFGHTSPNRFYAKLKLFEIFGVSKEDFNKNYFYLTQKYKTLRPKLKVAALEDYNIKELLTSNLLSIKYETLLTRYQHKLSTESKTSIFSAYDYYEQATGISRKDPTTPYPSTKEIEQLVDIEFEKKFPILSRKIHQLDLLYEEIKEQGLQTCASEEHSLDTKKLVDNVITLSDCIDNISNSNKEIFIQNMILLTKAGFDLSEITQKPNVLLVEPEALKVRLALKDMAKISNDEFLSGGYRKREDKVYARLMGLKSALGDLSILYSNENSFYEKSKLNTESLSTLFPYTEDVKAQFTTIFNNKYNIEESANEG